MSVNLSAFMEDKVGITYDRVKTSSFADIGSVNRKMTEEERTIIQNGVDRIYDDFTTKAALGRGLSVDSLKEIAQGRVWSGEQALEIGLVDKLGGLEDAIEMAAAKAELEDYSLAYYPRQLSFVEQFMGSSYEALVENKLKEELGEYYKSLEFVKKLKNMDKVQARLPYEIELK